MSRNKEETIPMNIQTTTYQQMMILVADAQRRLQHSADLTARHAMLGSSNTWLGKLVTRLHARNLDHLAKVDSMMTQWARYHGYLV